MDCVPVSKLPDASGEAGSFVGFVSPAVAYAALGSPFGSAAGAVNPNGVYKSMNANATSCRGITFTLLTQQPTTQSMGRIDLGIAPSDTGGNTVYASIANGSGGSHMNLGVFVTTNGGTSWTQTTAPDICHFQCWYDNVVKVDPTSPNTVFLGGAAVSSETAFEWVMRSADRGASWNSAVPTPTGPGDPTVPHVDEHALAFLKATSGTFAGKVRLYLENDGGLWRTDDAEAATVTWTNLNQNLTLTQFYPNLLALCRPPRPIRIARSPRPCSPAAAALPASLSPLWLMESLLHSCQLAGCTCARNGFYFSC